MKSRISRGFECVTGLEHISRMGSKWFAYNVASNNGGGHTNDESLFEVRWASTATSTMFVNMTLDMKKVEAWFGSVELLSPFLIKAIATPDFCGESKFAAIEMMKELALGHTVTLVRGLRRQAVELAQSLIVDFTVPNTVYTTSGLLTVLGDALIGDDFAVELISTFSVSQDPGGYLLRPTDKTIRTIIKKFLLGPEDMPEGVDYGEYEETNQPAEAGSKDEVVHEQP